ncbi:hypothetical protein GGR53DRAFT_529554 [Hypoxylon sp. FL1150]|nr:hypothetical protein GGR53DRAFT_529554 [Hypoxylon sp. FL1150]
MDYFPEEVIENIVSFLPDAGLSSFAVISSKWQHPVEKRTFSRLRINGDAETRRSFLSYVLSTSRAYRRTYLRTIEFYVNLPWPRDEQHLSNTYTTHIRRLFQLLALGDNLDARDKDKKRTGGREGITLELALLSLEPTIPQPSINVPDLSEEEVSQPLLDSFILSGGLDLTDVDQQLSEVKCVSRLVHRIVHPHLGRARYESRSISSKAVTTLVNRLPRLRYLDIIANVEHDDYNAEMDSFLLFIRTGLMKALLAADYLSDHQPMEVSILLDKRIGPRGMNRLRGNQYLEHLMGPVLRALSQTSLSFNVCGVFGPSLFWPEFSEPSGVMLAKPERRWSQLRNLHVKLMNWSSNGQPYSESGTASDDANVPIEDRVQALFKSWSKALDAMPLIEQATVKWSLTFDTPEGNTERDWLVAYQAPGTTLDRDRYAWEGYVTADMRRYPRLVFQNNHGWRPHTLTMRRLRKIQKERYSTEKMIELDVENLDNVTQS